MFISLYFIIALIVLLGIALLYVLFIKKKYRLTLEKKEHFSTLLRKIQENSNSKSKIIDLDKLLHHILLACGYKGTFGDILKKQPTILGRFTQEIWDHHKLRNKLVHEFTDENNKKLSKSAREYGEIISKILQRL